VTRRFLEQNVLPSAFVSNARRQSKKEFLAAYGDTQLLLVRLDDPSGELAVGLAAASTAAGERLKPTHDALGFATVLESSFSAAQAARAADSLRGRSYDATTLETQLVRTPHFVAPLRKRPTKGKPFVERVSVGRAHNNDIVLRHSSVSKFHAWLECDEERAFYVGDAKSKNGTKVNGEAVTGSNLVRLDGGDEIRFGQITSTICPPDTFWDVVAGRK
jgi:hypothetical protein